MIMASIENNNPNKASRTKKHLIHLDMTPMVDLGFLLISFFILTASMLPKGKGLNVFLPSNENIKDTSQVKKQTYYLLLADSSTFYCYPHNHIAKVQKLTGKIALQKHIAKFEVMDSLLQTDASHINNTFCLQASPICEVKTIVDVLSMFHTHKIKTATLQTDTEGEFAACQKQMK
jgi:biopolymer transport protein ExbD